MFYAHLAPRGRSINIDDWRCVRAEPGLRAMYCASHICRDGGCLRFEDEQTGTVVDRSTLACCALHPGRMEETRPSH